MREFLGELQHENPHVLENMLSAMGSIDTSRLLDRRFLDLGERNDLARAATDEPLPILVEETL